MQFNNSFEELLPKINESNFKSYALKLFKYQAKENLVYKSYINYLNIKADEVSELTEIPFLPIELFKTAKIKTGEWPSEKIFQSSGTTGLVRSRYHVKDIGFYHRTAKMIFENIYGDLSGFVILALLPSYLEQGDSSLISMVDFFIKSSGGSVSSYVTADPDQLNRKVEKATGKPVLLIGVAYALLDLAQKTEFSHDNLMIMETGGMKGRKKEMTREELHQILKGRFGVKDIHSEYGMTELTSQAYGESGHFRCPPWMRVLTREIDDPFAYELTGNSGAMNIIDLANVHTCAFIETKDLGKIRGDGRFEILGRIDNSDIRGCNLLIA